MAGKKRKISIRKILQAALTLVLGVCCLLAMVSASKTEGRLKLTNVNVHINNAKKYHFIEEKQILDEAIVNRNIDIMNTPVGGLDMQAMEKALKNDPWVADAQLYVDNSRTLNIVVTQRLPVARIFEQGGHSYFIDTTLSTMPLTPNFVYYTSVVTNVPVLGNDSAGQSLKKQIVQIVREIQMDTFWNAQVSQIIVDSALSFELVPVLGDQRIIFGDTTRAREKFDNLYAFYRNVLNRIGWDHYETLDVRFKGQVVASPALPYSGPVDKAIANMNWVNSIIETEARNDSMKEAADERSERHDATKGDEAGKKGDAPKDNKAPQEKHDAVKPEKKETAKKEDAKKNVQKDKKSEDGKAKDKTKQSNKHD